MVTSSRPYGPERGVVTSSRVSMERGVVTELEVSSRDSSVGGAGEEVQRVALLALFISFQTKILYYHNHYYYHYYYIIV